MSNGFWRTLPLWARLLIIFIADLLLFSLITALTAQNVQLLFYVVCVIGGALLMWREFMLLQTRRYDLERELEDHRDDLMRRLPDMLGDRAEPAGENVENPQDNRTA